VKRSSTCRLAPWRSLRRGGGLSSAHFCPDLAFLLVVALGVLAQRRRRRMAGAISHHLLSGSLLGQHALLRLAAYAVARFGNRHLNLRGALPQAVFVAALTGANAFGMALLTSFFSPGSGVGMVAVRDLLPQAVVNVLFAPLVALATARTLARLGDEEGGQRVLPIAPRGRIA
jgi:cell shape-determining protein MreD